MERFAEVKENARRRALLVGAYLDGEPAEEAAGLLDELKELAQNLDFEVAGLELVKLRELHAHYLVGSGKFAQIKAKANRLKCGFIIFDNAISPAQQRNWERDSRKCVIDRQEVILEIFARRAATKEAVLQTELARLKYSLPRLKRSWTHLSRQRGGGVTQRGAGESQLETDRRRVLERIARLGRELESVRKNRSSGRKLRQRAGILKAAIVGYTNAGKSSLLNKISGANVAAEDRLFATLDPTTREIALPAGARVLATDTVGFIRRLPHDFVEAFKSTLEEAALADALIHVVDASSPDALAHIKTAEKVLADIGAGGKPAIMLLNKCDKLGPLDINLSLLKSAYPDAVKFSVKSGEGVGEMLSRLESFALEGAKMMEFVVPHSAYGLLSELQNAGAVRKKAYCGGGVAVSACVPEKLVSKVLKGSRAPSVEESETLWRAEEAGRA